MLQLPSKLCSCYTIDGPPPPLRSAHPPPRAQDRAVRYGTRGRARRSWLGGLLDWLHGVTYDEVFESYERAAAYTRSQLAEYTELYRCALLGVARVDAKNAAGASRNTPSKLSRWDTAARACTCILWAMHRAYATLKALCLLALQLLSRVAYSAAFLGNAVRLLALHPSPARFILDAVRQLHREGVWAFSTAAASACLARVAACARDLSNAARRCATLCATSARRVSACIRASPRRLAACIFNFVPWCLISVQKNAARIACGVACRWHLPLTAVGYIAARCAFGAPAACVLTFVVFSLACSRPGDAVLTLAYKLVVMRARRLPWVHALHARWAPPRFIPAPEARLRAFDKRLEAAWRRVNYAILDEFAAAGAAGVCAADLASPWFPSVLEFFDDHVIPGIASSRARGGHAGASRGECIYRAEKTAALLDEVRDSINAAAAPGPQRRRLQQQSCNALRLSAWAIWVGLLMASTATGVAVSSGAPSVPAAASAASAPCMLSALSRSLHLQPPQCEWGSVAALDLHLRAVGLGVADAHESFRSAVHLRSLAQYVALRSGGACEVHCVAASDAGGAPRVFSFTEGGLNGAAGTGVRVPVRVYLSGGHYYGEGELELPGAESHGVSAQLLPPPRLFDGDDAELLGGMKPSRTESAPESDGRGE